MHKKLYEGIKERVRDPLIISIGMTEEDHISDRLWNTVWDNTWSVIRKQMTNGIGFIVEHTIKKELS